MPFDSPNESFETPENISVSYQLAGLGTRFVAWIVDMILVFLVTFLLFLILGITGVLAGDFLNDYFPENALEDDSMDGLVIVTGIFYLIIGFGSFIYFFLAELFMRGQTPGKKSAGIRVAKLDGFSLDPFSIFVRSLFRVVDNMSPVWLIPLLSKKHQRIGDLVGGTIVIVDNKVKLSDLRQKLSSRTSLDSKYVFDYSTLNLADAQDFETIEEILEGVGKLEVYKRTEILRMVVIPLAAKLEVDAPPAQDFQRFLEDLLAAEFRRQNRKLG